MPERVFAVEEAHHVGMLGHPAVEVVERDFNLGQHLVCIAADLFQLLWFDPIEPEKVLGAVLAGGVDLGDRAGHGRGLGSAAVMVTI